MDEFEGSGLAGFGAGEALMTSGCEEFSLSVAGEWITVSNSGFAESASSALIYKWRKFGNTQLIEVGADNSQI